MKNKGFFKTVFCVCSGTEGFPVLIQQPFPVTILNILLLTFFCALFNIAIGFYPFFKEYNNTVKLLERKFSKIEYSDKGIRPELNPDKPGTIINDSLFRIDYFPNNDQVKSYKPESTYPMGVFWSPQNILFWIRTTVKGDNLLVFPMLIPVRYADSRGDLIELLRNSTATSDTSVLEASARFYRLNCNEFKSRSLVDFSSFTSNTIMWIPMTIPVVYIVYLFSFIVINIVFISMLYLLLFAAFAYFFLKGSGMKLAFSELFKTAIYTAFPGFIIATIYTGLKLPYLDFQTIFLMSYFIYYFAVFSRLKDVFVSKKRL